MEIMIKTLAFMLTLLFTFSATGYTQPFAYIANSGDDTVTVINTSTKAIELTLAVGDEPISAAVTPDGKFVYVVNFSSDNVSVIDTSTNTVITTIGVGTGPFGVAVSPDGKFAYVSNDTSEILSVIKTSTNTVVD
jgi:YVTN family beta-propeller protein